MNHFIAQGKCRLQLLSKSFIVCALLLFSTGCALLQQLSCAPHNKDIETKFPVDELQECFSTNTYWASHPVFCLGQDHSKQPVVLLHELPGLTAKTLNYAKSLSDDFTVYVPMLYGSVNQSTGWLGNIQSWWSFSFNGEWGDRPELGGSTRIVKWLRHVVAQVEQTHPGQPIGVIGNCMTGALPLALLDNSAIKAVVLAQPTLPLPLFYYSDEDLHSLGISKNEMDTAKDRRDIKIYGVRFISDCVAPPQKQRVLEKEFGDRFIDAEIQTCEYTTKKAVHSTLIGEWSQDGSDGAASRNRREEVRKFLKDPSTFHHTTPKCPVTDP